ncbi:MAG TPA: hypothetical protein VJP80_04425 [Candidatus Saccharimonadales bacterium]|nr:hypothetical protein [Candidatus Saccharimonadales bacterium]
MSSFELGGNTPEFRMQSSTIDPSQFRAFFDESYEQLGDRVLVAPIAVPVEMPDDLPGIELETIYPVSIGTTEADGIPQIHVISYSNAGRFATLRRVSGVLDEVVVEIGCNYSDQPRDPYRRAVYDSIVHGTRLAGLDGDRAVSTYDYINDIVTAFRRGQ